MMSLTSFSGLGKSTWLILSLVFLLSCNRAQSGTEQTLDYDAGRDYFPDKVSLQYAKNFSVSYHKNYKVVRTNAQLSSWEGNGEEAKEDIVVLVQRGTPAPALTGDLKDATIIQIPAKRVAVNIQNGEVFLNELGLSDNIVAVGGAVSYDDSIREKVINQELAQVGYSWHRPANMEVLLEEKVDLFLMNLSNLDFAEVLDRSRQLGIPATPVFEWSEGNYLARAEWIKFYSLFFNAEARADSVFNEIVEQVEEIRALTSTINVNDKPTMIWGYYSGDDRWIVHRNSIEAQFMRDIGVLNILEDFSRPVRNEGESISSEELLTTARNASHWMIGDIHSESLPSENYMKNFNSWSSGRLYHNMKRSKPEANAFDWYGRAIVRPDLILADMTKLIYPEIDLDHKLYFMDHFDKSMKLPPETSQSFYN
ncbi:MAG: ABC transporter substrate-binding protein [Balneola sp.]|nr:MAG: ABC transporter substrate-binding protein [Balneola sp.]